MTREYFFYLRAVGGCAFHIHTMGTADRTEIVSSFAFAFLKKNHANLNEILIVVLIEKPFFAHYSFLKALCLCETS